jgi:nicotinamide riboside transporter PnuC
MELLAFIFEATLCLLDMFFAGADIYSWLKGRPNRVERKEAKKSGIAPPPRDKWNRRVIVLTLVICIITILLFALRSRTR